MTGGNLPRPMQSARESAGSGGPLRLAFGGGASSCQHDPATGRTSSRPGAVSQYRYPSPQEWPAPTRRRSLHPAILGGGCLPGQESLACADSAAMAGCPASGAILIGEYPCRRSSNSLALSLLPAPWPPVVKLPPNALRPAPSSVAPLPPSPAKTSPTAPLSAVLPVRCPARSRLPRRTASDFRTAGFRPACVAEGPSGSDPRRSFFFARSTRKS